MYWTARTVLIFQGAHAAIDKTLTRDVEKCRRLMQSLRSAV